MIADYRSVRVKVSSILTPLKIPRRLHYYSPESLHLIRWRKGSMITDSGIMEITDEQLLLYITDLMSKEFTCYGYGKKFCRILKENNFLSYYIYNYGSPVRNVLESTIHVIKTTEVWKVDIKYVYMHSENRTASLFVIINCCTRKVVAKHISVTDPVSFRQHEHGETLI